MLKIRSTKGGCRGYSGAAFLFFIWFIYWNHTMSNKFCQKSPELSEFSHQNLFSFPQYTVSPIPLKILLNQIIEHPFWHFYATSGLSTRVHLWLDVQLYQAAISLGDGGSQVLSLSFSYLLLSLSFSFFFCICPCLFCLCHCVFFFATVLRAVTRKTPVYFILIIIFIMFTVIQLLS